MKINANIESLLNEQINMELYSAHQYLAMASYFLSQELNGFGNFFTIQAQEENVHALKHFKYLHEVDGALKLGAIAAPQQSFSSALEVFKLALAHEEKVTASIYSLIDAAMQAKDFATYTFLEWFVTEQVEEEALMRNLIKKLELIGNDTSALYFLDEELGRRTFQSAD